MSSLRSGDLFQSPAGPAPHCQGGQGHCPYAPHPVALTEESRMCKPEGEGRGGGDTVT